MPTRNEQRQSSEHDESRGCGHLESKRIITQTLVSQQDARCMVSASTLPCPTGSPRITLRHAMLEMRREWELNRGAGQSSAPKCPVACGNFISTDPDDLSAKKKSRVPGPAQRVRLDLNFDVVLFTALDSYSVQFLGRFHVLIFVIFLVTVYIRQQPARSFSFTVISATGSSIITALSRSGVVGIYF
jgi:hypothetical protein